MSATPSTPRPVAHRVMGLLSAALLPWSPRHLQFADTAQQTVFADTEPAVLSPSVPGPDGSRTASAARVG